ncbi:hypothetical protein GNF76_26215 [Pseudomonas sp. CCM 7893]|uniref:Uncharacterized protein n=1 Tax=Pseudomonas spelaei TaxID=1055469 RepID=A0A6I3WKH1_9PSED|nr:hypothetical protein [Pseudomonas spelaei]MUF07843.1 hypothetical protein [Pseudomonas spelaei]
MTTPTHPLYSQRPTQHTLTLSLLITLLILQLMQFVIILPLLNSHFWWALSGAGLLNSMTLYIATVWLTHIKKSKTLAVSTRPKLLPITLLAIACVSLFLSPRLQMAYTLNDSSLSENVAFLYVLLTYAAAAIAFSTSVSYSICKPIISRLTTKGPNG